MGVDEEVVYLISVRKLRIYGQVFPIQLSL